jgi:hypothetical protein
MSDHKNSKPSADERFADALEAIAASNQAIVANQPRKRKTYADLLAERGKREMPFPLFQNYRQIESRMLSDADLQMLSKLKEGRFCNGKVTVWRNNGIPERPWHIDYDNVTINARMDLKNEFQSFNHLLKRITTETPEAIN